MLEIGTCMGISIPLALSLLSLGCTGAAETPCGKVHRLAWELMWEEQARVGGAVLDPEARDKACLGALEADFNHDGRLDSVIVVSPNGQDVYLLGALNVSRGWHAGVIEDYKGFGVPRIRVARPGHYETHGPGHRELEPAERMEIEARAPGVFLQSETPGIPSRAFFLGEEFWIHVRQPRE